MRPRVLHCPQGTAQLYIWHMLNDVIWRAIERIQIQRKEPTGLIPSSDLQPDGPQCFCGPSVGVRHDKARHAGSVPCPGDSGHAGGTWGGVPRRR